MPRNARRQTVDHDLFRVAEEVVRSGRRREVTFNGTTLTIGRRAGGKVDAPRRRRENGLLAAYGSVRPLNPSLSDRKMDEIAAEEAAEEAAGRAGSPADADA